MDEKDPLGLLSKEPTTESKDETNDPLGLLSTPTTQDEVAKKKSTHFYIECGRWYIHIGIRTEK